MPKNSLYVEGAIAILGSELPGLKCAADGHENVLPIQISSIQSIVDSDGRVMVNS